MGIHKNSREKALRGNNVQTSRRRANTSCDEHWHEYYEMIYYSGTEGTCTLNGKCFPVRDNCLFLMTPKDFHKTENAVKPEAGSVIIQFTERAVDIKLLELLSAGPIVLYDLDQTTRDYIKELDAVSESHSRFKNEYLSHLLCCLLIRIIERGTCSASNSRKSDPVIRDAIAYILANIGSDITLTGIAEKYGLSPTYFSHLFHSCTGMPFKKYLTSLRIEYAKRLLEDGELPVIDVGYECGFYTPSQFVRAFKAETGEAPSRYRAARRK